MAIKTVLALIAIVAAVGLLAAVTVPITVSAQYQLCPREGSKFLSTHDRLVCVPDKPHVPNTAPPN